MLRWIYNKLRGQPWAGQLRQTLQLKLAKIFVPRDWIYCKWFGVNWKPGWRLRGLPVIRRHWTAQIVIGERFSAISGGKYNSIGVFQKVMLMACGRDSEIIIGDDVGISGCTISAMRRISIGHRVLIGSGSLIMDNDAHAEAPEDRWKSGTVPTQGVTICDDVFIGARVIILKGVTVGTGSVVGAGSVVTRDIPPMVLAAGNPARVIRPIRHANSEEM